jgi:hypothetical protein
MNVHQFFNLLLLIAILNVKPALGLEIMGETIHQFQLRPYEVFEGEIRIGNNENRALEVKIYITDYLFQSDGTTEFPTPGKNIRSNATWFEIDNNQVAIPQKTNVTVHFRGKVPQGNLSGTYWSMVMVEGIEPISAPLKPTDGTSRQVGIRTTIRHGIQIVTDLGEPGVPSLKVKKPVPTVNGTNSSALEMDVSNGGDWMVWPDVSLQIFGKDSGALVTNLIGQKVHLYPGCSYRYRFPTQGIKGGKYDLLIMFDAGKDNLTGARYAIELPD